MDKENDAQAQKSSCQKVRQQYGRGANTVNFTLYMMIP